MDLAKLVFLAVALFPLLYIIYLVRGRSRSDVAVFAGLAVIWVLVYQRFVFGQEYVFHDTLWDHHAPYAILLQWLDSGFSVGWNPFPDGGEPLYLLSNLFLWAELLAFWLLNRLFGLPIHDLLNLYFSYILISFSGFCFLLFGAVFRQRITAFYALVPVLLGGLTIATFGQYVLSPLYLTPLALLSAYLFVRDGAVRYLGWTAFFVAVSANHYLPQYLVLVLAAFFVSVGLVELAAALGAPLVGLRFAMPRWTRSGALELALIAPLTGAALAPALYVHREVHDLVSPTRGGVRIGEPGVGHQPPVIVNADRYQYLVHIPRIRPGLATPANLAYHHSPFYIGWLPVLLATGSLLLVRDRVYLTFLLTLVLIMIAALGEPQGFWAYLRDQTHLLYFRHAYPLALALTVLIVLLSGLALDSLPLPAGAKFAVALLTLALCLDGTQGRRHADARWDRPFDLAPFTYPVVRWPYSRRLAEVPIDSEPTITKRAAATHPDDDFVLFRSPSYQQLLRRDLRLVTGGLFVFGERLLPPLPPLDSRSEEIADGRSQTAATRSRDHARLLNGRIPVALRLRPRATNSLLYHANAMDLRGRFVEYSACVESPSARLGVNLLSTPEATAEPVPASGHVRTPVAQVQRLSTLDTYRGTGQWECFGTNFQVGADRPTADFGVAVWAEHKATAYVGRVRVGVLADVDPDSMVPLPGAAVDSRDPSRVRVQAVFPRSGFLVRRENFHPGWAAQLDGVPVTITRWSSAFQAVAVSAGRHTVDFAFRSPYPVLMWLHFVAVIAGYVWFARALVDGVAESPKRREAWGA